MKSKHFLFLIMVGGLALGVAKVFPQTSPTGNEQTREVTGADLLASLASTNVDERLHAAEALDARRKQLIKQLIAVLRGTNSDQIKLDAVTVLGQYRAWEAIPVLIEHLDLDGITSRANRQTYEFIEFSNQKGMAVSGALYFIGMPAVAPLLDKVANTDDTNTMRKCVSICGRIEGVGVAQYRLNGLLDKETDPIKKARLQSALEMLKNNK